MQRPTQPPSSLQADQRGVFHRLLKSLGGSDVDSRYDAIGDSKQGKVVSVDVARFLIPEFASWDGRLRHTPATGIPAGFYAHDRLHRTLTRPSARKRLLITAGGAGSGKTSLLKSLASLDLVFDNQFKNRDRARELLNLALRHTWEVGVEYVHRPFDDIVRAVIERSQRTGRWNLLSELPAMHIEAQRTIVALRREFRHRGVIFRARYNASKGVGDRPSGSSISFRELTTGGCYYLKSKDELLQTIPPILDRAIAEGKVCKEVAEIIGRGLPR